MPLLTTNFPKYGLTMKLLQIGSVKKDFQGKKTIQNTPPQKHYGEGKRTWIKLAVKICP